MNDKTDPSAEAREPSAGGARGGVPPRMKEPAVAGAQESLPLREEEPAGKKESAARAVPPPTEEPETDPGALLKQARERSGASIADIAASTRLDETLVEALEESRYDAFPAPAYVYGYVRAYAREVGLDGDTLVRRLGAAEQEPAVRRRRGVPPRMKESSKELEWLQPMKPPLADRAQRYLGALFGGVVAVVLIAAAVVLWMAARTSDWPFAAIDDAQPESRAGEDSPTVADRQPSPNPGTTAAAPTPAPSTPPRGGEVDAEPEPTGVPSPTQAGAPPDEASGFVQVAPEADPADPPASLPASEGAEASEQGAPPPSEPIPETVVADADAAPPSLPDMDDFSLLAGDQLLLSFDEDSWVEVEDASGEIIHAELGASGESHMVHGQAPFSIVIGYAPGVRVAFNGDPVALPPHTRQTVARLVVGP